MENLELINEAVAIIGKNLKNPFSVPQLASRAGYSLYYFIRMFKSLTGTTPGEYITLSRISGAAAELSSTGKKIIEIAYDYQFSTPEAFSRAFRRITGCSPASFRKLGSAEAGKIRSDLNIILHSYRKYSDGAWNYYEPERVDTSEMLVAGRVAEISDDYSAIGAMWREFSVAEPPSAADDPLNYMQFSFWDDNNADILYVMAAVSVSDISLCDSFVYKKIPAASCLKFPHYGDENRISETYSRIFSEWMPCSDFRLNIPFNMEIYPDKDDDSDNGVTAWILLPVELL